MRVEWGKGIDITEEELRDLNALPETHVGGQERKFSEREDAIIMEFYPKKAKKYLAEYIGISQKLLKKRYEVLTGVNE